jgi:hypothetical protein
MQVLTKLGKARKAWVKLCKARLGYATLGYSRQG